jgi:hypothetical protein
MIIDPPRLTRRLIQYNFLYKGRDSGRVKNWKIQVTAISRKYKRSPNISIRRKKTDDHPLMEIRRNVVAGKKRRRNRKGEDSLNPLFSQIV